MLHGSVVTHPMRSENIYSFPFRENVLVQSKSNNDDSIVELLFGAEIYFRGPQVDAHSDMGGS